MNWISVQDKFPSRDEGRIIVAIMKGRIECGGDPVEDAKIVMLRASCDQWMVLDTTERYYSPDEENLSDGEGCWTKTINYWVPWQEFPFPESMLSPVK